METLLEAIRSAVAPNATAAEKAAGATACRTILAALEAKPGEPLTPEQPTQPPSQPAPPVQTQIASAVSMLRGVPADQLLDLLIARLRAALPTGHVAPPVQRLNVPLVPVPQLGSNP